MKALIVLLCFSFATVFSSVDPICKGKKKDNTECRAKAKDDGFCVRHSPNTPRCNHPKKSGGNCQMIVKKIGQKCHHHQNK